MDWNDKRFEREMIFQAPPALVLQAARDFAAETLNEWRITETADGFEAKGRSDGRAASATFQVTPHSSGAKVAIALVVQRSSAFGFMLFDLGFYDSKLKRWLEGIQWHLYQRTASPAQPGPQAPRPNIPKNAQGQTMMLGCLGVSAAIIVFSWVVQSVYALIGLFTANLYLMAARGLHDVMLHGLAARLGAALILLVDAVLVWAMVTNKKRRTRPKILSPND
jgi:hypothetical protein